MERRSFFKISLAGSTGLIFTSPILAGKWGLVPEIFYIEDNEIKNFFLNPPSSANPQVWWCWVNGHITKEDITSDLESMKRVGIRGFQLLEFSESTVTTGPVIYGSPEHFEMLEHTSLEADRLDLDFSIHNCPGWASTGGSWISPELSMQVLTWSEIKVAGGTVQITLPEPSSYLNYYKDAIVIAIPTPENGFLQIYNWRVKANFPDNSRSCHGCASPPYPSTFNLTGGIIDPSDVLNISSYMNAEGFLNCTLPAGNWTILRAGHTTTKSAVFPAPPGGSGLECDKFSKYALEVHFENYYNEEFLNALQSLIAKGKAGVEVDSFEAGLQNWTAEFPQEFQNLCGYDLANYLPAMTGKVVGSIEISDRFLWDVRKVQAIMMKENYYDHFNKLAHDLGLKTYAEAYYYTQASFDNTDGATSFDVPMGEFWVKATSMQFNKIVSSIGHINNKPMIAGEAFTMDFQWKDYPGTLKITGDIGYTLGINHFYLNHMAVSPSPYTLPELYVKYGGILNVNNTWFEQGKAWIQYMARCEYILQQGRFVADILYFGGEDSPVKVEASILSPKPPYSYDFDIANTDTILNRLNIENGVILIPDCMSYKVLFIPDQRTMTLELLSKLHTLVMQGMTLIVGGTKPDRTPGLKDYPDGNEEFLQLAQDIWTTDGSEIYENALGEGIVYHGMSIEQVLIKNGVKPDFEYTSKSGNAIINKIHKRINDDDVYFIASRSNKSEDLVCTFRVSGKHPEFWNPVNGEVTPCSVFDYVDDQIVLPLQLVPFGSLFVIFREPASDNYCTSILKDDVKIFGVDHYGGNQYTGETLYYSQGSNVVPMVEAPPFLDLVGEDGKIVFWQNGSYTFQDNNNQLSEVEILSIKNPYSVQGPWNVSFSSKSITPGDITLEQLMSLTNHGNLSVKYFSGTASYKKIIEIGQELIEEGIQLYLDLGKVMVLAEVIVNGVNLGILWTAPYRVNITEAVQAGQNNIEVIVTNTWINRLIGNNNKNYNKGSSSDSKAYEIQESGLIGPVLLRTAIHKDVIITNVNEVGTGQSGYSLKVYPNPVKTICTVSVSLKVSGNLKITVSDYKGQVRKVIYNGLLTATEYDYKLDVSDLPAGLYFISLRTDSFSTVQKLVVEK